MELEFNAFNLLVLFGAVQGLILGCLLFFQRGNQRKSARFLGMFMLILAYNGFETFNWSAGLNYEIPFGFFPFVLIFGIGPSLYLYVYALTHPQKHLPGSIYWHYAPVAIQFFVRAGIFVYYALWMNNIEWFGITPSDLDNWYGRVSEPLSVVAFWVYLLLAIRMFRNFSRADSASHPALSGQEKKLVAKWLKFFLLAILVLGVMWILTVFAPSLVAFENNQYYFTEIFLVMLIYWIAFGSYHRTKVIYVTPQKSTPVISNGISTTELQQVADALQRAMQADKLYLDPELTVSKLAAHLQINPKVVSAVLNQRLQKGFSEFVNEYRIAEVKTRLLAPENAHLTIAGIALASGFNSQATFGRTFKSVTGMSPKEFLSLQTQKSA